MASITPTSLDVVIASMYLYARGVATLQSTFYLFARGWGRNDITFLPIVICVYVHRAPSKALTWLALCEFNTVLSKLICIRSS